jgi:hypothetical protein
LLAIASFIIHNFSDLECNQFCQQRQSSNAAI